MTEEFVAEFCRGVTFCRPFDQLSFAQLLEAGIEDGGRDALAAFLQNPEGGGASLAESPEHAHGPAAAEQIEQRHDRRAAL